MMGDRWGIVGWLILHVSLLCLLVLCSFATTSFTSVTDCRTHRLPNPQALKSTKMSSEAATCPGCDHTFSLRGYQNHLALTRDPLCRAVFDKLKKANDAYELLKSAEENSSLGAGSDTEAMLFQGDAFGTAEDYASDTFGQATEDNPPPLMEVSDDEDDDDEDDDEGDEDDEDDLELAKMVAELEKSWEPPREGAPRQEAIVDDDDVPGLMNVSDDEDDDEDDDKEGAPRQEMDDSGVDDNEGYTQHKRNVDRFIIGDGYGVKPAVRIRYNDKYTSARAGQPLTHQESRDHVYGAALGGGDNPWAPFNSKKDWEIARWAKLRGAGSTAFSELLAIDGVRFNSLSLSNHTIFIHVYFTGSRSPQLVIQKLGRTQSNHRHQVTWTATIHTSGGCAERRSLRVLHTRYP